MATSGRTDVWVTSWDTLRFDWWQDGRSIADNYTDVTWSITLISASSGAISSTASKSWNATINGSYYEGTTTVNIGNNTSKRLAYGTTRIYHNSDGNKEFSYSFNVYFGITFGGSRIETVSGSGSSWLEPIPRQATITSAPDFTDEENPTIYYSNPAGSAVTVQACISLTGAHDDVIYRNVDPNSDHYTFNLNEIIPRDGKTGHDILRENTTGKQYRFVTFFITTWIGNNAYYSTLQRTYTVLNCAPELNPTVVDEGTVSTQYTGDPFKMIRGFNYIHAIFNATPKKGAVITSRKVTCGSDTLYGDGWFYGTYANTFTFTVTDNRGLSAETTITMPAIDYVPVTCNVAYTTDLSEDNNATINLTISGNYFDGSFGAVNNSLNAVYRYKELSGDFPIDEDGNEIWTPIGEIKPDNKYSQTVSIAVDDYTKTYVVQAKASDAVNISGVYAKEQLIKIVPVYDWSENDFKFNVPVSIMGNPVLTLNNSSLVCKAYTQETDISYAANSYIKLFRDGSPTDLQNVDLVRFADNGIIYINKDMLALVNVHIVSQNPSGRSWIRLMNYSTNWKYTDCISYGEYTTSQITMIVKLTKGTSIGVVTAEAMNINASGLAGSYIEIYHL